MSSVTDIRDKIRSLIGDETLTHLNLPLIIMKCMTYVNNFNTMSGSEKKDMVVSVLQEINTDNTLITDEHIKSIIDTVYNTGKILNADKVIENITSACCTIA